MTLLVTRSPRGRGNLNQINDCSNPSFEVDTSGWTPYWFGNGANGTNDRVQYIKRTGTSCYRKAWTSVPSGAYNANDVGWSFIDNGWGAGTVKTASAYIYTNTRVMIWRVQLQFYDANNNTLSNIGGGNITVSTIEGWTRVWTTATGPAGAVKCVVSWQTKDNSDYFRVNDVVAIDSVQIEPGSQLTDFFDGSFSEDTQFAYSWRGAANASGSSRFNLDPATKFTPTLVLGWDQDRPTRTQTHQLYGGAVAAVLLPSGLRRGTITYFFGDRDNPAAARQAAYACESAHASPGTWRYIDDDQNNLNDMTYVVAPGQSVKLAISDTRRTWTVAVPFQEVTG